MTGITVPDFCKIRFFELPARLGGVLAVLYIPEFKFGSFFLLLIQSPVPGIPIPLNIRNVQPLF